MEVLFIIYTVIAVVLALFAICLAWIVVTDYYDTPALQRQPEDARNGLLAMLLIPAAALWPVALPIALVILAWRLYKDSKPNDVVGKD
jgi:hypothetical protein